MGAWSEQSDDNDATLDLWTDFTDQIPDRVKYGTSTEARHFVDFVNKERGDADDLEDLEPIFGLVIQYLKERQQLTNSRLPPDFIKEYEKLGRKLLNSRVPDKWSDPDARRAALQSEIQLLRRLQKKCVKQTKGRYVSPSRKSPRFPAVPCAGQRMRGADRRMWVSTQQGKTYRWVRVRK